MIQEYLFLDDTYRKDIEEYVPDKIKRCINDIENSSCWIVTYSVSGKNEDNAKALSAINDYVVNRFHPTVLTNESSAYFNNRLYPYINDFERKLRKLLYLKCALYNGEKKIDNIRDLESKDLGEIFELLFSDSEFVENVRKTVNRKSWLFTKQEIITNLQNIAEDTIWSNLIGAESVVLLSSNFTTVKGYRNDVMHAHNINFKIYHEAKELFETINEQLDIEIGQIIQNIQYQSSEAVDSEYNNALSNALRAQEKSYKSYVTLRSITQTLPKIYDDSQLQALRDSLSILSSAYNLTELDALREASQKLSELAPKLPINL